MAKTPKHITLENGPARAVLRPQEGRLDILPTGSQSPALTGAAAGVTFAAEGEPTLTTANCSLVSAEGTDDSMAAVFQRGTVELRLTITRDARPGAFVIALALLNAGTRALAVKALLPLLSDAETRLETGSKPASARVYRIGWNPSEASRAVGLAEPHDEPAGDAGHWGFGETAEVRGLVCSAGMAQVSCGGGYLTCGFLRGARQFGAISTAVRAKDAVVLSAAALLDGKPIAPGRTFTAEPLYISIAADFADALRDCASAVGEATNARRFDEVPAGWSSGGAADEAECLANLRWVEENRHSLDLRTFLIGDGWQQAAGDSAADETRFPHGMKALADEIRAAGLVPGLSFAPFMVEEGSQFARSRPELLVGDGDGAPLMVLQRGGRRFYALDLTNPEALSQLAQATSLICRRWGYGYLRADFLYLGAAPGARLDPTKTGAQNIRRGLEVIRQVAGEDVYIAAAACPPGPAEGMADGVTVSSEGSPWIISACRALARGWMHGLLWHNDSGSLPVGAGEAGMSDGLFETLANAAILSGGALFLSGRMHNLPAGRMEMLKKLFPAATTAAVPLDLYRRTPPAVYFAAGESVLLGVFNWGESAAAFKVNPARITRGLPVRSMREFWRSGSRDIPRGAMTVELEAHESRLFVFE